MERPSLHDFDELTALWEASVRSTHHFLTEELTAYYKKLVRNDYLPAAELYIVRDPRGVIAAFMGLSEDKIEMLFVRPDAQGHGYGTQLIAYATGEKQICQVDVNEQNPAAFGFYRSKGFAVVGRDALDPSGKPFPILHMRCGTASKK